MSGVTQYSQEVAASICERLANGESLRTICCDVEMPAQSTVFKWLSEQAAFSEQYTRAREAQADFMADEILAIADDGLNDTYVDEDGRKRTDQDVIARSRLRVDARKWLASKMAPKKYGDKVQTEVSGGLTVNSVKELTNEQLATIAAGGSIRAAGPA